MCFSLNISLQKFAIIFLIKNIIGSTHGVMHIVIGNEHGNLSSNPGQVCLSHLANIIGKVRQPTS